MVPLGLLRALELLPPLGESRKRDIYNPKLQGTETQISLCQLGFFWRGVKREFYSVADLMHDTDLHNFTQQLLHLALYSSWAGAFLLEIHSTEAKMP